MTFFRPLSSLWLSPHPSQPRRTGQIENRGQSFTASPTLFVGGWHTAESTCRACMPPVAAKPRGQIHGFALSPQQWAGYANSPPGSPSPQRWLCSGFTRLRSAPGPDTASRGLSVPPHFVWVSAKLQLALPPSLHSSIPPFFLPPSLFSLLYSTLLCCTACSGDPTACSHCIPGAAGEITWKKETEVLLSKLRCVRLMAAAQKAREKYVLSDSPFCFRKAALKKSLASTYSVTPVCAPQGFMAKFRF